MRRARLPPTVVAVDAVGLTVADADRSAAFFRDVLGFEKISDVELTGPAYERLQGVFGLRLRVVRMRLGAEAIELYEYLAPRGRALPADSRGNDRWFQHLAVVVSDLDRAYARLREHRVEHASSGPQRLPDWNPGAGGIEAFYFRDPDGHSLELIEFPPAKGNPRWQDAKGRLFLGIDHTAIVVADTDARANDLLHWQTGLVTADVPGLAERLFGARAGFVSPGPVELPAAALGFRRGMLVADPDGHALRIRDGAPPSEEG